VDQSEIDSRLKGRSADPKLAALLTFAKTIVDKQGLVSNDEIGAVRAAGYNDGAIAEVTAHVAANIFTNYINHVAQTDIDFPVVNTQ
jgi:alkylhydroperoxidase family enzyme